MLAYWILNLYVVIRALFKSKIRFTDPIRLNFRVGVTNTDFFYAMQAGQYFSFTDAGRWEFAVRSGLFFYSLREGIIALVAGQKIIYKKPIRFLSRFQISMKIMGWDEEWMYAFHVFHQGNKVCAVSATKLGYVDRHRQRISPQKMMQTLGYPPSKVEEFSWLRDWFVTDKESVSKNAEDFLKQDFR